MIHEILKEIIPLLEKSAPVLSSMIGAPIAGFPASVALHFVASKFGLTPDTIGNLVSAIQSDPDSDNKLASIESDFKQMIKGSQISMPSSVEINIKMNWNNIT